MTELPEHLLKRAKAIRDQRERDAQLDPVKALREQHERAARFKQAVESSDSSAESVLSIGSVDSNLEKKLPRRSSSSQHSRTRISLIVLDFLFLIGTLVSLFVRSTPASSDEQKTYVFVLTLIVLFALLLAFPYFRLRTLDNSSQLPLTNEEKVAIKDFRSARKSLGRMKNKSKSELKQRSKEFRDWNDQKGKLIFSVNGVRVFERWLDTPSVTGSIKGLSAHVVNFFDVNVEGPPFNGRMIAQGLKKPQELANKINTYALKATNNESHRQKRLKELPSEIAALQNDSRVDQADAVFKVASDRLSGDIQKSMEQRVKRVTYAVCAVIVVAVVSTTGGILNAQRSNPMLAAPMASTSSTSSTSSLSTVVDVRSSAWAALTKSVRSSALSKSKKCGYSGMTVSNTGEYMVYQWANNAWGKARVDTSRWSFTDATNTAALDVTGDNVDDFLLTVPTWDPFSEDQPKAAGVLSQVKCEWTWIPFKASDGRNHYQLDRLRWDSSVNKLVGDDELTNIFADNYDGNRKTKSRYFVYSAANKSFVRASGAPRVTPSTIALADLPSGSVVEAQFQCGTKLFETLEAYNITNLSPNNIGTVWFNYSDYKFRVGTTPTQIKSGLVSVCAEAAKVKLAEVKSAVISSCSWNKARLARAYGVPVSSSKTKVARAVAGDFRKVMQSQVASWCVAYIK